MLFREVKDIWRIFALSQIREITGTEQGVVGDVTGSEPFRVRVGFCYASQVRAAMSITTAWSSTSSCLRSDERR